MRRLFLRIDEILRRRQNIEEFCSDADCVLRIKVCRAERSLPVENGVIEAGAPLLELHFWNEQLPRRQDGAPSISWAAKGLRALLRSFAMLARHVERSPELGPIAGVFGITTFMSPGDAETAGRLLTRLGFSYAPHRGSLGAFGDFWENLHVWFMNRTFAGGASRPRLSGLRRVQLWMSREEFLHRYGTAAAQSTGGGPARRGANAVH